MSSSRLSQLSDSSDSDTEHRPSFGQKTSVIKSPKKRLHESDDILNYHPRKRMCQNLSDDDHYVNARETGQDHGEKYNESHQSVAKKANNIGERLMEKMGYSKGEGLGIRGDGIREPIEAFKQKGRRGLGHDIPQLREATIKWDPSQEVVDVQEPLLWLPNQQEPVCNDELRTWLAVGPKKETIDDETNFCDANILSQVLNCKSIFDTLDKHEMRRARTRSNPFESIRSAFFLNRAAVKMANMDKACGFMFTDANAADNNELLYFADVCAGPGGFSEYVLWRKKWHAKGFGFTLRDANDFKLDDFYAGSPETFHPFYGPKEDGNVYDPDNQEAFKKLIMSQTRDKGVHFMMADGGFSVEGKENIQEILSKQLYLCQCLVALMIVRTGGHFVTKVFDLFTPFSAGLVYLMYRSFKSISIFKPNTSRPANSERYLICNGKLPDTHDVVQYLSHVNRILQKNNDQEDVVELVPMEILRSDERFFQYLKESNEDLGKHQVVGLLKIAAYCEDSTLTEIRQGEMKKRCLEYWDLPNQSRKAPRDAKPDDRLNFLVGDSLIGLLKKPGQYLSEKNMESLILSPPCDWYCVPCAAGKFNVSEDNKPTFYFGMGRSKVYKYANGYWTYVDNVKLPPDTLIYAEMVAEYRGHHKTQMKTIALHIIDAWLLGGENISDKYLPERHSLISQFCEALWKPEPTSSLYRIRPKEMFSLDDDLTLRIKPEIRVLKNGTETEALFPMEPSYSLNIAKREEPFFFIPKSVMFLKCTKPPWRLHLSRTTGHHYFFNAKTNETAYNNRRPDSVAAAFDHTFAQRVIWHWSSESTVSVPYLHQQIKLKCPSMPK